MFFRALAIWLLLLIVAVLNGAIREVLITPRFGEQAGHIESTANLVRSNYSGYLLLNLVDWTQGQTRGFGGRNSVASPHRRL